MSSDDISRTHTAGGTDVTALSQKFMWLKKTLKERGVDPTRVDGCGGVEELRTLGLASGILVIGADPGKEIKQLQMVANLDNDLRAVAVSCGRRIPTVTEDLIVTPAFDDTTQRLVPQQIRNMLEGGVVFHAMHFSGEPSPFGGGLMLHEIAPLVPHLTALHTLDLRGCVVTDLSPLSGLAQTLRSLKVPTEHCYMPAAVD